MSDFDSTGDGRRVTGCLTLAVVSTYLLLALGATVATRGAAATCSWPTCVPGDVDAALALVHRAAAVVAFGVVVAGAVLARNAAVSRRVRWPVYAAAIAFPGQALLGGAVAVGSLSSRLHLLVAVGIFATLLGALVFALEEITSDVAERTTATTASVATGDVRPSSEGGSLIDNDERTDNGTIDDERTDNGTIDDERTDGGAGNEAPVFATARAYLRLTKPRLVWLLCLLALGGIALAALSGVAVDGVTVVATLAGGTLAIGASGVANQLFERERDRRMARTDDRPLATSRVSLQGAVTFCLALVVGSMTVMWAFTTPLATGLTVVAMGYYGIVYTLVLKPNTRWSTLIGGVAGALPAVIGWAAVTGSVGLPAAVLFALVVLWTPAHFYNLALAYREDYARGGFPLVPVVEGPRSTRRRTVAYLGATLLAAITLGAVAELGALYALVGVAFGGVFLWTIVRQYRERTAAAALRTFHVSNAFLGGVLVAIVFEAAVLA